jgi:hypothetical protein
MFLGLTVQVMAPPAAGPGAAARCRARAVTIGPARPGHGPGDGHWHSGCQCIMAPADLTPRKTLTVELTESGRN